MPHWAKLPKYTYGGASPICKTAGNPCSGLGSGNSRSMTCLAFTMPQGKAAKGQVRYCIPYLQACMRSLALTL